MIKKKIKGTFPFWSTIQNCTQKTIKVNCINMYCTLNKFKYENSFSILRLKYLFNNLSILIK